MTTHLFNTIVIGVASAQEAQAGSSITQMLFFISFIFMLYYFIYARPVQKDQEDHAKMVNGLIKGDKVVSIGGICGEIVEVQESTVLLDVGRNSYCTLTKSAIKTKLGEEKDA